MIPEIVFAHAQMYKADSVTKTYIYTYKLLVSPGKLIQHAILGDTYFLSHVPKEILSNLSGESVEISHVN